jgi:hypothetical protein
VGDFEGVSRGCNEAALRTSLVLNRVKAMFGSARRNRRYLVQVHSETFCSEPVLIDGHRFTACTFDEATFVYEGGLYEFEGCTFLVGGNKLKIKTSSLATKGIVDGLKTVELGGGR